MARDSAFPCGLLAKDGDAIWHKRFKGTFKEEFELHRFPFDVQDFHLVLVAGYHHAKIKLHCSRVPSLFHINNFSLGETVLMAAQPFSPTTLA